MTRTDIYKQGRIKPKVLLGFFIVFAIAASALMVTYKGFVDLTQTRQNLSEPSQKLIRLNSILTDIYEAESNIRTYTLTQNEGYLSIYLTFMANINKKVDSLLLLTHNDPIQADKIKFIQGLLKRKRRVLTELIHLRQSNQSSMFYQRALEEVEMLDLDSLQESSVIRSVKTTKTSRRDSVVNRATQATSGLGRFFRWLSKKEPADSIVSKLIVEVETQVDTLSRAVMSPSDSLLSEVVKILTDIQTQQEMSRSNISAKELELLKSDKEVMDQIRTVLSLLEREELMNSYRVAEEVKVAVQNSTQLLIGLGGAAFLMVVVFTWLIFRDISKANFYRNRLIAAKQYAEKLLKVKEEFLANMNHEIRTPLSAIVGLSRQLQKTANPKQKYFIESLNASSQHLLQIVNDILDLTKIEGGHLRFERIPFDPHHLAREVLNSLSLKAEEKGLTTSLEFANKMSTPVLGDPFRLKQILINLVGNAVKFTSKGQVSVWVDYTVQPNGMVCYTFKVSDTGIGIPSDKLEAIFDQFSQVDTSTTRKFGGTGLGLAIVKKLTELQGGDVRVESQPGKGTTFTVTISYLLFSNDLKAVPHHSAPDQAPNLPANLRIIVVDDDPISQLLVSEMLYTLGVKAVVYSNPFDALEAIPSIRPDFILTDIQMPGMSGIDLVTKVKSLPLDVTPVVIALTANSTADKMGFYIESGFHSALTKPFSEFDLYNTIAPLVGQDTIENDSELATYHSYDTSEIRRFAGDDDESFRAILQSFIDNSKANVSYLLRFVEQKNWKGVGEVAHRMKSAFRQLKVNGVALILEELERIDPKTSDNEKISVLINEVCREVELVQELLRQDIEKISVKS